MSKKKPIDKAQARERRNRMLDAAAAAQLSLTEGVREMRAIAGMTQEEFAQHRGVSVRVIKAIELGQGNPTVATLNKIGQFFGLEVAFVPIKRLPAATEQPGTGVQEPLPATSSPHVFVSSNYDEELSAIMKKVNAQEMALNKIHEMHEALDDFFSQLDRIDEFREKVQSKTESLLSNTTKQKKTSKKPTADKLPVRKATKTRSR